MCSTCSATGDHRHPSGRGSGTVRQSPELLVEEDPLTLGREGGRVEQRLDDEAEDEGMQLGRDVGGIAVTHLAA